MKQIVTERLVLKKPCEEDKQDLASLLGNLEVSRFLSRVPHPYTVEDAEEWIRRIQAEEFNFSIYLDNYLIGGIGLSKTEENSHDLGYWLGSGHWGLGYATESVNALLDYSFDKLDSKKIRASVMKGNTGSINVLLKLGFKILGEGETYSHSLKETVPSIKFFLD